MLQILNITVTMCVCGGGGGGGVDYCNTFEEMYCLNFTGLVLFLSHIVPLLSGSIWPILSFCCKCGCNF